MGLPYYDENGVKQPQMMRWTKRCAYCLQGFESNRDDAQTCSNRCRTALHRQERRKRIRTGIQAGRPT